MPQIGDRLGKYEIVALLGEGGMGAVYRARNADLGRDVALKLLQGTVDQLDSFAGRFHREMTLMTRMDHPGLVKILECGALDGIPFIAMEILDGVSLWSVVKRRGATDWATALAIVAGAADALQYLHANEILHRDLSPGNIFLTTSGQIKLLDFGLARAADSTLLTEPGTVMGTTTFLAPELLSSAAWSAKSDLWALGCVLWMLLTGRVIFEASAINEIYGKIMFAPLPRLDALAPGLPAEVVQLIETLIVREPEKRCASAGALRDAAARLVNGSGVDAGTLLTMLARGLDQAGEPVTVDAPVLTPSEITAAGPATPRRRTGKSVLRSSQKVAPISTPLPVTHKRRGAALGGLAAVALLGVALVAWRLHAPAAAPTAAPTGSPSPAPTTSAASPSPTAAPPEPPAASIDIAHSPPFRLWRAFTAQLPVLRAGGEPAQRAVKQVAALTKVRLRNARQYVVWHELGEWAARPGVESPPQSVDLNKREPNWSELALELMRGGDPRTRIVNGIGWVNDTPSDGRAWLFLAEATEASGAVAEAKRLYGIGLARLEVGLKLPENVPELATALARAGFHHPSAKLAHLCADHLEVGPEESSAWINFSQGLYALDTSRHMEILNWLVDRKEWQARAVRALAETIDRRFPKERGRQHDLLRKMHPGNATIIWIFGPGDVPPH